MLTAPNKVLLCLSLLLSLLTPTVELRANNTCSRVAKINYQEILIDASSKKKGEGLRYYLEKDPKAIKLLDKYQEQSKIQIQSAVIGTAGSGLILAGLFTNEDNSKRETLLISGISLLIINFLYSKTTEGTNEKYLEEAIEVYNQRNLPRIQFNVDRSKSFDANYQFMINKDWSF